MSEKELQTGRVPFGAWVNLMGLLFCSKDCYDKGVPVPVREQIDCFLQFHSDEKPRVIMGIHDAFSGFDCLSKDPEYVEAWNRGMKYREQAQAAKAAFEAGVLGVTLQ